MQVKRAAPLLFLLATSSAFAVCSTVTQTWDAGTRGDTWGEVESYHEYNITNNTGIDQNYNVCYELVTQMFDHSHIYRTNECKNVLLKSGQASGTVPHHLKVKVNYPKVSSYYYVAIDADTVIRGECQAHTHLIKRLKVY